MVAKHFQFSDTFFKMCLKSELTNFVFQTFWHYGKCLKSRCQKSKQNFRHFTKMLEIWAKSLDFRHILKKVIENQTVTIECLKSILVRIYCISDTILTSNRLLNCSDLKIPMVKSSFSSLLVAIEAMQIVVEICGTCAQETTEQGCVSREHCG